MRTVYHEFESLEHLLSQRLLPGGGGKPIRLVVFGGTGAVGGATVLELAKLCRLSRSYRDRPFEAEIYATGSTEKEIASLARRLYLTLGEADIEKVEPLRHYRIDGCIDLHLSVLRLELPDDLGEHVALARQHASEQAQPWDLEEVLDAYFRDQPKPFLRFVEQLGEGLLHAVVVGIPLPSVATYALGRVDRLVLEEGLDFQAQQRIKSRYLHRFIRGLAVVQQRHARAVIIAHTTGVGGMVRVDGGHPEIRLGFAHSALGKKLVEKKHFADELAALYLDQGFDVLVTAAAIGIDSVELHARLPLGSQMRRALGALPKGKRPVPMEDRSSSSLLLYPAQDLPWPRTTEAENPALDFGSGKDLMVGAAVRSGENGLFSVANCVALYQVMKVAIPEELALVLVRHAVFGPERRRGWFRDKIAYYTETESSQFALRLLDNYPQLRRAHLGAFAVQAFQALGSSTHQARLHELGLLLLLLRLRAFAHSFQQISESELLGGLADMDDFLCSHSGLPAFEDLDGLGPAELAAGFTALCETQSKEEAGLLLDYDLKGRGLREGGREKFLARLATSIRRYLSTITSLGCPILYRSSEGEDRLLVGPYVAPLETAVGTAGGIESALEALAEEHGLSPETARHWVVCNNGFVDLRPHALGTSAAEASPQLGTQVRQMSSEEEVLEWIESLSHGSYFTTCGTVALCLRLGRLSAKVRERSLSLGTFETWRHLFLQDARGRHILAPGLVETARLYSEGLGKVTGMEVLWPRWGY